MKGKRGTNKLIVESSVRIPHCHFGDLGHSWYPGSDRICLNLVSLLTYHGQTSVLVWSFLLQLPSGFSSIRHLKNHQFDNQTGRSSIPSSEPQVSFFCKFSSVHILLPQQCNPSDNMQITRQTFQCEALFQETNIETIKLNSFCQTSGSENFWHKSWTCCSNLELANVLICQLIYGSTWTVKTEFKWTAAFGHVDSDALNQVESTYSQWLYSHRLDGSVFAGNEDHVELIWQIIRTFHSYTHKSRSWPESSGRRWRRWRRFKGRTVISRSQFQ